VYVYLVFLLVYMVEAGFRWFVEPIGYRRACGGRGTKV
jgi:hypothetical protein